MQLAEDEDPTMVYPSRFDHDLFYVAPFYHKFFPDIDKMIVLDLDLEFRWISEWKPELIMKTTFAFAHQKLEDLIFDEGNVDVWRIIYF